MREAGYGGDKLWSDPADGGLMIIALALGAAFLIGVGLVLQQHAAEQAPKALFLHLRLIRELMRKRRWLAGIGIMAAGQIAWAWVLGNLDLSVAEPLLSTSLLFALIFAVPLAGERLQKSEIVGAVLLAGGVAALSVSRSVSSEGTHFGSAAYWPAAAVIGAIALLLVRAGWRRQGQQRATLTGLASGLVFGISDALTRSTLEIVSDHGVLAALTSWSAYSLAAATMVALWLMESAFNAAPLHASLPAITAAQPVIGILLGVLVFADVIRISPAMIALQAAGIAALVGGVILVARAPVLSSLRPSLPHRDHGPAASHDGHRIPAVSQDGHQSAAPSQAAHRGPALDRPAPRAEREEV